jgi:hypothetical protein
MRWEMLISFAKSRWEYPAAFLKWASLCPNVSPSKAGGTVLFLGILLGHGSLETTQIYTHLTIVDLKEAHKKFHPRERERGTA